MSLTNKRDRLHVWIFTGNLRIISFYTQCEGCSLEFARWSKLEKELDKQWRQTSHKLVFMTYKCLIENLKKRLQAGNLPGDASRRHMTPSLRFSPDYAMPDRSKARQGAVLIGIYPYQRSAYTVFMQRTQDGRVHGGQISFPGGSKEENDADLVQTALREAQEEMGIAPDEVEIGGCLTPLYIPASNFEVLPVVGILPERPVFVPDAVEVAAIIETDLLHLSDKSIIKSTVWKGYKGYALNAPYYELHGKYMLWGATAMMVAEFLALLENN